MRLCWGPNCKVELLLQRFPQYRLRPHILFFLRAPLGMTYDSSIAEMLQLFIASIRTYAPAFNSLLAAQRGSAERLVAAVVPFQQGLLLESEHKLVGACLLDELWRLHWFSTAEVRCAPLCRAGRLLPCFCDLLGLLCLPLPLASLQRRPKPTPSYSQPAHPLRALTCLP